MKVTYLYHSGFLVETESAVFLFDYFKGELPAFPAHKPLYIFASHKHPDHFDFQIFRLKDHPGGVSYVFGNDIRLGDNYLRRHGVEPCIKDKIYKMAPHKELAIGSVVIKTLKSTDAGVAFYVRTEDIRIYHAGDLNWWHWEGESEAFNAGQKRVYQEEINYLKHLLEEEKAALDVAFVPLDPRLGDAYDYGMHYFLTQILVKTVYPMHMWDDYDVVRRYMEKYGSQKHIFFTNETYFHNK